MRGLLGRRGTKARITAHWATRRPAEQSQLIGLSAAPEDRLYRSSLPSFHSRKLLRLRLPKPNRLCGELTFPRRDWRKAHRAIGREHHNDSVLGGFSTDLSVAELDLRRLERAGVLHCPRASRGRPYGGRCVTGRRGCYQQDSNELHRGHGCG